MKARIFIGSSSEGYDVAEYVHSKLNADFECYLWKNDLFKYNSNPFETLLHEASFFDFGILIATKDDFQISRDKLFEAARDNIVFEFGLFLGRLGASRTFFVQEKECKIPSDLLGITVPVFERTSDLSKSDSLNKEIDAIRRRIDEKVVLGELGLLPSTALAIGYFYNLVSPVCDHLYSTGEIAVAGRTFRRFQFRIVMPDSLDTDMEERATLYYRKHAMKGHSLEIPGRSRRVYVSYAEDDGSDLLLIHDLPTTLLGIDQAIELYMRKGYIGKSPAQKLLEERELRNFRMVLESLIAENPYCRSLVSIIGE